MCVCNRRDESRLYEKSNKMNSPILPKIAAVRPTALSIFLLVFTFLARVEGITGVQKVIDMTAAAHLYFNPHTWSSAINTAAALHLTATAPNYIVFELKPLPSPLQYELVTRPIQQHGGWVRVPDGPGLGIEIVEDAIHKYLFDSVV